MKKIAIIVAGGAGLRAGGGKPKQLRPLDGKPVFIHSIEKFHKQDPSTRIILVINSQYRHDFESALALLHADRAIDCRIVEGGESRAASVKNALDTVEYEDNSLVAIHDAARPLVSIETIKRGWETASAHNSAIPAIPLTDSIRHIENDGSKSVNRAEYLAVQTPQVFNLNMLKQAYDKVWREGKASAMTDDASVFEWANGKIHTYEGELTNIKITGPLDLYIAEAIIQSSNE